MRIYVKNVPGIELTSEITDKELIVLLQASDRGLISEAKVTVDFYGKQRKLDIEAIDRERTLPHVVFAGYSIPPPAMTQSALCPRVSA